METDNCSRRPGEGRDPVPRFFLKSLRGAFLERSFHSPLARESLLFAWPLRRRSGANSAAGPEGGGQEPDVKRSNQEEGHPKAVVYGHPALRLRGRATATANCKAKAKTKVPSTSQDRNSGARLHEGMPLPLAGEAADRLVRVVLLIFRSRVSASTAHPHPTLRATFSRAAGEGSSRADAKHVLAEICFVLAAQDAQ